MGIPWVKNFWQFVPRGDSGGEKIFRPPKAAGKFFELIPGNLPPGEHFLGCPGMVIIQIHSLHPLT